MPNCLAATGWRRFKTQFTTRTVQVIEKCIEVNPPLSFILNTLHSITFYDLPNR